MERHSWVVSDPPHSDIDFALAGKLLGITQAEARIKLNFKAPEVWLALGSAEEAAQACDRLQEAGVTSEIVPAQHLLRAPPPAPASSFAFGDDHMVFSSDGGEVRLRYDQPVIASFCAPPPDLQYLERRSTSPGSGRHALGQRSTSAFVERLTGEATQRRRAGLGTAVERRSHLDLYWSSDGSLQRASIAEGLVDFSGLGDEIQPRARDNVAQCVARCSSLFSDLKLDTRMVNVRPRQRLVLRDPTTWHDDRRLFSFGTVGLHRLLESVSPELATITQYELGSRLSYLLLSRLPETDRWRVPHPSDESPESRTDSP